MTLPDKKSTLLLIVACLLFLWISQEAAPLLKPAQEPYEGSIGQLLIDLGNPRILSQLPDTSIEGVNPALGEALVKGERFADGQRAKRISAHFDCTSCHSLEKESPDIKNLDPDSRLMYTRANDQPYLPGSPLYGIVSRTHFYNGDYQKKYGRLAEKAHENLRAAIQLCATECSQGRTLQPVEMESILSYLWTLDIPAARLDLRAREWEGIHRFLEAGLRSPEWAQRIKSEYTTAYPATFVDPPSRDSFQTMPPGDPEKGKWLYEQSCMHCHENKKYSFLHLDTGQVSLRWLNRKIKDPREGTFHLIRYGTSPVRGERSYMPNYTLERMSKGQLMDLRAYLRSK